jgi:hypothetical protein
MAKSPSRFNLSGGDSLNSLGSHGGEVADPMIEAPFSIMRPQHDWPLTACDTRSHDALTP